MKKWDFKFDELDEHSGIYALQITADDFEEKVMDGT